MIPLTKVTGVPDKSQAIPGMAYFAGTGPYDTYCSTCRFRGLYRKSQSGNTYKSYACAMYKSLTGRYGPVVRQSNPSCRYYENKESVV